MSPEFACFEKEGEDDSASKEREASADVIKKEESGDFIRGRR